VFPDVSHSIHFEAIMNIPEWQAKVMKSTPKAMLKQAMMSSKTDKLSVGGNGGGSFLDDYQQHLKNVKKNNIDSVTGKRKWTRKIDVDLHGSEYITNNSKVDNKL
jgi:hypothetical protein